MRLTLTILLLTAAVLGFLSTTNSQDTQQRVHAFGESLKKLQREPPAPPSQTRATVREEWIEQKLDHFDSTETETWQMRYLVNDEHFKAGGPMFIYVGGEWTVTEGSIKGGHFYDMAEEHNGILYYTEHRYYGQSRPTSDLTVDNLKYLHVKQALADLAHFIEYQRETESTLTNAKVILAGGSYSATMVVWFEQLYPELLAGGWASSAPLLAKVDFREYKEVVGKAIQTLGSQKCYNRIQNGIAQLESMLLNEKRGAEVKSMLKICNNFREYNDLDVWSLFGTISNIFSGIIQYQSDDDVDILCQIIMVFEDDLTGIANLVQLAFGSPPGCLDFSYKDALTYYMDSTYENGESRSWFYQTCNEYGWYQTSASSAQPFGTKFPATLYTTLCSDIYGELYQPSYIADKVTQTNEDFGGSSVKVSKVYMTHGSLDPWSPMGSSASTFLTNASHCADFGSISENDSSEMNASKENIANLVRQWLL